MAMGAGTFVQSTLRAVVALFAIAAGLYLSPWLGSSSFVLALLCWLAVIIGLLYAAERLPWIDRIDSISRLLRSYAPPLSDEEKQEITRLAGEQEQSIWDDVAKKDRQMDLAQKDLQFFTPSNQDFNNSQREQPESVQGANATKESPKPAEPLLKLEELTGLASVKKAVRNYENRLKVSKARGDDALSLQLNFALLGPPGTGKTSVAQIMGRIFYDLGCLPTDKLVEARKDTLVAGYLGQSAIKTHEVLESALGGTLFIDEVYSLTPQPKGTFHPDPFNKEAIDTIVPFLEKHRGKLAVIIAGYEKQVQEFLKSNPGLPGRFTNFIDFPNYTPQDCIEIFNKMLVKQHHKLKLTAEAAALLPDIFSKLRAAPYWANARDVRSFLEEWTLQTQANRVIETNDEDLISITDQDLQSALAGFLEKKNKLPPEENDWLK